jgi:hypothetical protein
MGKEKMSKADQMRQHLEACKVSGMYVEQYCKEQKLNPATYYYWRKKLAEDSSINSGLFIQLQSLPQSSCVEIVFTNGVTIHFDSLVPAAYLKQLVS